MNRRQRTWVAASLAAIGVAIAAVALEWDARPVEDQGIKVIGFSIEERTVARQGGVEVALPPCRGGTVDCSPWERAWQEAASQTSTQVPSPSNDHDLFALLVRPPPTPTPNMWIGREAKLHGLFVRSQWGAVALLWGGLLPLVLFAVAGFVALGSREK